jgi:hypothetical protein
MVTIQLVEMRTQTGEHWHHEAIIPDTYLIDVRCDYQYLNNIPDMGIAILAILAVSISRSGLSPACAKP